MIVDVYVRKSNDDGGRSAGAQETECCDDITGEGWTVGRVFADPDRSASRYARKPRPDYAALIEHIESGQCEALALWEASRGSRNLSEWVALIDLCRRHEVPIRITTHRRTYDVAVRRDWRTLADEGVDAADESERIAERTQRGKRIAAAKGLPCGQLTYGYRRIYDDRGRFVEQVPHPEQAGIVREIIERAASGHPLTRIARDLSERGVPAPEGGARWHPTTIRKLAMSPTYAARRIHRGEVFGPAAWPALIDDQTHQRAVARLSDPSRLTQHGSELRWLLSGVPKCSRCDGVMRSFYGGRAGLLQRRYRCHVCRRTMIDGPQLDALIEALILARLARPDAVAAFRASNTSTATESASATVTELEGRLRDLYREAAAGRLSAAGLAATESTLLPELERARTRLARLYRPDPLIAFAGHDPVSTWGRLSVRERREVVTTLAVIMVGPATSGRPFFDADRLRDSRWTGDTVTWGEAPEWAQLCTGTRKRRA